MLIKKPRTEAERLEDERRVREELGDRLGVEFATPDDLLVEQSEAELALADGDNAKGETRYGMREITVGDLIRQCNDAVQKMSSRNPHKVLIYNCAYALDQLTDRISVLEQPTTAQPSKMN